MLAFINDEGHLVLPDSELTDPVVRWIVHAAANRVIAREVGDDVVVELGMSAA